MENWQFISLIVLVAVLFLALFVHFRLKIDALTTHVDDVKVWLSKAYEYDHGLVYKSVADIENRLGLLEQTVVKNHEELELFIRQLWHNEMENRRNEIKLWFTPDWSKAPKGATHCEIVGDGRPHWFKKTKDKWFVKSLFNGEWYDCTPTPWLIDQLISKPDSKKPSPIAAEKPAKQAKAAAPKQAKSPAKKAEKELAAVDWSKAPKGATHYDPGSVSLPWFKIKGDVSHFWDGKYWILYGSGEELKKIFIKKPTKAK